MSSPATKLLLLSAFVLFSFIFIGGVIAATSSIGVGQNQNLSYPSWLIVAYLAGLSMIILPCTLPLVFIIVPLSMGQNAKKGLIMAMLFGLGLTLTITIYGMLIGFVGKTAHLDQISFFMFTIAGIAAYVFGLSQLKLLELHLPSYSGTPKFIQQRGDYSKSFFMGILLGNAGVGCPNPLFYWLLIYIAGTGSMEIGASLGFVHGVGRTVPLVLFSILAILGVNSTKRLTSNRIKIEKITGWMLIVLGSFLIINGLPGGHEWYENTFIHIVWNNLVSMISLPPEYHISQHSHTFDIRIPEESVPVLLISLLVIPLIWHSLKNKRKISV